jgi:hypothetical protein
MKSYNSIPHWNKGPFGEKTIAFDKSDGSNMRFEWSKNKGWYKFGTRNVMISKQDENFGDGIDIFLNKYGDELPRVFNDKYKKLQSAVVFAEYYGENSFAGQHVKSDIKDVLLFDVSIYKKGMINPFEFVENFGHLSIPEIIYTGEYSIELVDNIRNNNHLKEGVVCKGITKTKKEGEIIWMSKIKTNEWLREVKKKLGSKALLDELNGDNSLFDSL